MTRELFDEGRWGSKTFLSSTEFDNGICISCEHLHEDGSTCDAFPKGMPSESRRGLHDHHKPYPGDKGIRFEKRKGL